MIAQNSHCIEVCNSLLRGEISAVETYSQALEKMDGTADSAPLQEIRRDHQDSVAKLTESIRKMGGVPATDSGAWGDFAKAVEGGAKMFGENSALEALVQGEAHGKRDYEDALEDPEVLPGCKEMIRGELLPRQLKHISSLEGLKAAQ